MLELLQEAIDKSIIARDGDRFTVHGVAPGTVQLTPGPSVDTLGFDFVLYQSTPANTTVTFDQGVRLEVLIPEPGACAMGIGCLLVSLNRRRCRA